jgi:hypothetical protein
MVKEFTTMNMITKYKDIKSKWSTLFSWLDLIRYSIVFFILYYVFIK